MITIGVNYSGGHDSAAAIARDGRITFAIAEERLSRKKQDAGFPIQAIQACLRHEGITPQAVDKYVVSWPPPSVYYRHNLAEYLRGQRGGNLANHLVNLAWSMTSRRTDQQFERHGLTQAHRVVQIDHHLSHALSVAPYLAAEEALIFVLDGRGAAEATSVYKKQGTQLQLLDRVLAPNSLGSFYAEVTAFCGFQKYADEWKVMGLAPYGKRRLNLDSLLQFRGKNYRVNHRLLSKADHLVLDDVRIARRKDQTDAVHDELIKDFAYSAQAQYEDFLLAFVGHYMQQTGISAVGMAGGVGLNCKANGRIATELPITEIFIQPAATDDGTALGAALYPFYVNGQLVQETFNPYLGLAFTDTEIEQTLQRYHLRWEKPAQLAHDAAKELANGQVIGWYQGRDEFGPRALGNRSILADPRRPEMKDRVNEIVKYRENWRPFAPSLLAEHASTVLARLTDSPYMILTDQVSEAYAALIPAVVHVDQTLRPQTVNKALNAPYWALLDAFYQQTGVPVLMNTSFNLKGEPNVCSPTDAIRTYFTSGLNLLYLGGYKVFK